MCTTLSDFPAFKKRGTGLGTIALVRCDDFVAYPAPWKLLQEGAAALVTEGRAASTPFW